MYPVVSLFNVRKNQVFSLLSILLITLITACKTDQQTVIQHPPDIHDPRILSFDFSSAFETIKIMNDTLFIQKKINIVYNPPYSDIPASYDVETLLFKIPSKERSYLNHFIDQSGFWDLKDVYGADENIRYYPYQYTVSLDERTKSVLFRSNPDFEGEPEPLKNIYTYLKELAKRSEELK